MHSLHQFQLSPNRRQLQGAFTFFNFTLKIWTPLPKVSTKKFSFFVLASVIPPELFGLWLLNDDELFGCHNSNITQVQVTDGFMKPNRVYNLLSPAPTFTGKYALLFSGSYSLKV